jgi:hypothetical protein
MIIPFGDYAPDKADLGNAATVAENCIPKAGGTYGPFADLSAFSGALDSRCQGAYAGVDDMGGVSNFAGDAGKLYLLSDVTYGNVSRSAGYTTSQEEAWRFCQFGNRIITTNFTDDVQTYVLGSSSIFSSLSTGAPKARHCAILDPGFLFLGNTVDPVDGAVPNRVWWSGYNDPTNFPTAGSVTAELVQSDFNDLPYGGWVNAVVGAVGGASGLVLCETAIYRIDYAGPPTVFQFTCIERSRGTPAPNSVVNIGPFIAFLGPDGFYLNDGQQSRPIGAGKFDKSFYSDLNQSFMDRIYGAVDPINKLIIWVYPSIASYNGLCDSAILYSWESDRVSKVRFNCELVFRALSSSLTLENLDTLGFTMETLPASLDSRAWTGGSILLAAFDSSHRYSIFGGANLQATLETGEFNNDGRYAYVRGVRPMVDGGNPTVSIGHRNTPGANVTYTTATAAGDDGMAPQHISARYVRARVVIPSGERWGHAIGIEPEIEIEGQR